MSCKTSRMNMRSSRTSLDPLLADEDDDDSGEGHLGRGPGSFESRTTRQVQRGAGGALCIVCALVGCALAGFLAGEASAGRGAPKRGRSALVAHADPAQGRTRDRAEQTAQKPAYVARPILVLPFKAPQLSMSPAPPPPRGAAPAQNMPPPRPQSRPCVREGYVRLAERKFTQLTERRGGLHDEVVVMVSNASFASPCAVQRLEALLASRGARDVVLMLQGEWPANVSRPSGLSAIVTQRSCRELGGLCSYGDSRSGQSKPNFLHWFVSQGRYQWAWHVEDDVFYSGAWRTLFDRYSNSSADIVGRLETVQDNDHFGAKATCCLASGSRCFAQGAKQPCKHCKTFWPVMRLSRRLATAVGRELLAGGQGHHEAITGAICARHGPGCRRVDFDSDRTPAYALGGQPGFRQTTYNVEMMTRRRAESAQAPSPFLMTLSGLARKYGLPSIEKDRLFHPVKCQARAQAGLMQVKAIDYALPIWVTNPGLTRKRRPVEK